MSTNLFANFPKVTKEEWKEKAIKDLRGKPLEDLVSKTLDGIEINPFYTAEDWSGKTNQPQKSNQSWGIVQEILVEDELEANSKALKVLNSGTSSLLFYVMPNVNLEVLLDAVLIDQISIHFVTEGDGLEIINQLEKIVDKRNLDSKSITGSVNIDSIENAFRTGNWFKSEKEDFETIKTISNTKLVNVKTVCVNANLYGNAGATSAEQLGIALAHAHEYLLLVGKEKASKFWFNFSVGTQYFEEIAKLRAARKLWAVLLEEYEIEQAEMHIYAESGLRNKTIYDPWVNMLRTTTEGMSAVLGGANEVNLKPFNITFSETDEFGERVARNQQLIYHFESYLDKTNDPSSGSYFIENLTEDIAVKAWDVFKQIESDGGLLASMKSGIVQEMIKASAEVEQNMFDNGELNLLGTNIFPNKEEEMKSKVNAPMFSTSKESPVEIEPLKVVRLSEKTEKERLNTEQ